MEMSLEDILQIAEGEFARRQLQERYDKDQSINVILELSKLNGTLKDPKFTSVNAKSHEYTPIVHRTFLDDEVKDYTNRLTTAVYDNPRVALEGMKSKDVLAAYLLESTIDHDNFGAEDEWTHMYGEAREAYKILKNIDKQDGKTIAGFINDRVNKAREQGVGEGLISALKYTYTRNPELIKDIMVADTVPYIEAFKNKLDLNEGKARLLTAVSTLDEDSRRKEAYRLGQVIGEASLAEKAAKAKKKD